MTNTVAGIHLGLDTHANRPAANTVPDGSQYSCSTHSLIYKSNYAGNSWATWANLAGTGFADPMTTRGDMIVRDAANVTARLARGGADTYLGSDGTDLAFSAVTDAKLSTSDITTNNASTSKHGFLKKLSNVSTEYMDGTGAWSTPDGGGGGVTQAFVGYNTIGGSWQTTAALRYYNKKVTLANACLVSSVDVHIRGNTDNILSMVGIITTDNSNAPGVLVAGIGVPSDTLYFSNSSSMPTAGRWFSFPMGIWLAAGDYWLGVMADDTRVDIAYDGSGSDQYWTSTGFYVMGAYPTAFAITTSSQKFSIRANTLR